MATLTMSPDSWVEVTQPEQVEGIQGYMLGMDDKPVSAAQVADMRRVGKRLLRVDDNKGIACVVLAMVVKEVNVFIGLRLWAREDVRGDILSQINTAADALDCKIMLANSGDALHHVYASHFEQLAGNVFFHVNE